MKITTDAEAARARDRLADAEASLIAAADRIADLERRIGECFLAGDTKAKADAARLAAERSKLEEEMGDLHRVRPVLIEAVARWEAGAKDRALAAIAPELRDIAAEARHLEQVYADALLVAIEAGEQLWALRSRFGRLATQAGVAGVAVDPALKPRRPFVLTTIADLTRSPKRYLDRWRGLPIEPRPARQQLVPTPEQAYGAIPVLTGPWTYDPGAALSGD